jgi:hypothetical protein
LKCSICRKPIGPGPEAARRAEYRLQGDGSVKVFGNGMPGGPLAAAAGQLVKVSHNGCYWAARKREERAAR